MGLASKAVLAAVGRAICVGVGFVFCTILLGVERAGTDVCQPIQSIREQRKKTTGERGRMARTRKQMEAARSKGNDSHL